MKSGNTDKRPRVISYMRFSTPEQKLGDSLRRQISEARAYAQREGLEFDETLTDEGLSGYHGAHRKRGKLRGFLECVEQGEVPPDSILVVEDLSRLGRENVFDALQMILQQLIGNGIKLHVLNSKKTYDKESLNGPDFIGLWIGITEARAESERKSRHLKASWTSKREKAQNGRTILTSRCPAWLERVEGKFKFKPGAAETIRLMFQLKLDGYGKTRIESALNESAPWKRPNGWRASYIQKILKSRATIGEFQPHRIVDGVRKPIGKPIDDYFPPVVDPNTFDAVQKAFERNKGKGGKTGSGTNVFQNLVKCPYCGGSFVFRNHGKPPKGGSYLVCDKGQRGFGCKRHAVRYDEVFDAVLDSCRGIDPVHVLGVENDQKREIRRLTIAVEGGRSHVEGLTTRMRNLRAVIAETDDPENRKEFAEDLSDLRTKLKEGKRQLDRDKRRLRELKKAPEYLRIWQRDLTELKLACEGDDGIAVRLRLKAHMKTLVRRIELYSSGVAEAEKPEDIGIRRPRSTKGRSSASLWKDYRKEAQQLVRRRMTKEGRFIRVFFETDRILNVVPKGSIATGWSPSEDDFVGPTPIDIDGE